MDRLRVFLSSTQKDLQTERDNAESLVRDFGHECLRAETFDSPGSSPEETCKSMARSCDIYVGIFGPRYGFVVPNIGISATEMEYREAKKSDPSKIFIYVQDTKVLDSDQERFLEDVQNFSDGYFRHVKFANCDQLKEHIRRDVITWTTRRVREALRKDIALRALRDKVAHMSRVMEMYGIPDDFR